MVKMVDMKRSKAEQKSREKLTSSSLGDPYSYDHRISLDHDHMKKLGITQMPKPGDVLHLQAHAHVSNASENSDEDGGTRRHVSLQLKKMAVNATKKAQEGHIEEGNLTGAKAAMDQALDEQEMSKPKLKKHRKEVGSKS